MFRKLLALSTVLLAAGGLTVAGGAGLAHAGTTDLPFTVTSQGVTADLGRAVVDGDDMNVRITNGTETVTLNYHVEGNNQYGQKFRGQQPWVTSITDHPKFPGWANYCVTWVQVHGFDYHYGENNVGRQGNIDTRGWTECTTSETPVVASASLSVTPPSCDVAASLVLGQAVNATWGAPSYVSGRSIGSPTSYTVSAVANQGARFPDESTTKTFTGTLPAAIPETDPACETPISKPSVRYELGACYPNGTFSSRNLYFIFDNTESTVPVLFRVPGASDVTSSLSPIPSIERTVPAGTSLRVETTPVWQNGGDYEVFLGDASVGVQVTIPAFAGCSEAPPKPPVTPPAPTVVDLSCAAAGSYTLTDTAGVLWFLDGRPVTPGTHKIYFGGDHTVTAQAAEGTTFADGTVASWPLSFTDPDTCELPTHPLITPASVTAATAMCGAANAGSYTIPATEGILWFIGGSRVSPGTYTVASAQKVQVTAEADAPNFGLEPGSQTEWNFSFSSPESACGLQLATLPVSGVSAGAPLLAALALLFSGAALVLLRIRLRRAA